MFRTADKVAKELTNAKNEVSRLEEELETIKYLKENNPAGYLENLIETMYDAPSDPAALAYDILEKTKGDLEIAEAIVVNYL